MRPKTIEHLHERRIEKVMWLVDEAIPNLPERVNCLYIEFTAPEGTTRCWIFDTGKQHCLWTDEEVYRPTDGRRISSWKHRYDPNDLWSDLVNWMEEYPKITVGGTE